MESEERNTSVLDAALEYLARGWSVIPVHGVRDDRCTCGKLDCPNKAKHPALGSWKKYQEKRASEADIRRWFGDRPDRNIGIVTGEVSGIVVLDVDGEAGHQALAKAGYEIPTTVHALTGGGGDHYFFSYPEGGLGNSVSSIAPKVDVRGDRGFVVASPSIHKLGASYQWKVPPGETALAAAPSWMLVAKADQAPKGVRNEPPKRLSPEEWTMPVKEGSRNNTATRLAGGAAGEGCTQEEVLDRLQEWNREYCQPPLDNDELAQVVVSVFKMENDRREGARSAIDQMMAQLETLEHGAKLTYAEKWLIPYLAQLPPLDRNSYSRKVAKSLGVQTRDIRTLLRPKAVPEAAKQEASEEILKLGHEFMTDLGDHALERVEEEVRKAGLAGEASNAKLLYLALTSRLLNRPVSMVVKGTSSSGKSYTVATVLRMFPRSQYIERTGLSPKALAYSNEDFRHRTIVLFEVEGIGDEGEYLLRSLLSEGCILYETVESTPMGLVPRVISKEGPTNCILTTTRPLLHPENETRLLSVVSDDSPEQTRRVLKRMVTPADDRDFSAWHAAQHWLRESVAEVTIPFAQALAKETAASAPRMRRDFRSLLSLIESHALLSQAAREKDADGRIIATVDGDYVVVRDLVADVVAQGIRATVKPEIRETVEAVEQLLLGSCDQVGLTGKRVTLCLEGDRIYKTTGEGESSGVSLSELSARLKLDRSSVSRRVKEAEALGFLVNLETRAGRPDRLFIGEPMPADNSVFPSPEDLG